MQDTNGFFPDPSEFDKIYREKFRDIYRYAYKLCRDASDAEDLTQQAFAKAYANRRQFQSGRPILNWLQAIVKNLFLDQLRRRKRRPQQISLDTGGEEGKTREIAVDATLDAEIELEAVQNDLQRIITRLTPEQKSLLWAAHIEGKRHSDIAKDMGLKCGTVKSRLHRLHVYLRERSGLTPG